MQTLAEVRGARRSPTSRGCPTGDREGPRAAEQGFCLWGTPVSSSGPCPPGEHRRSRAGPLGGWVGGREGEGGWDWDSPGPRRAFAEGGSARAAQGAVLRAGGEQPRSARRTGPSVPGGTRDLGGEGAGARHATRRAPAPGSPREHPRPPAALSGCKTRPPHFPVPSSVSPPSRGRRAGGPRGRAAGGRRRAAAAVTCEDSDADLMVVVGEDHPLGRHVSPAQSPH